MSFKRIGVCAADAAAVERAEDIAQRLNVPYITHADEVDVALMIDKASAWLRRVAEPTLDWHIDFLSSDYRDKRANRTRHNDTLSRAIGLHKKPQTRVLDMSAGLGKDAYWLAYCGATVTLLERNPLLAYLLEEAIHALRRDPAFQDIGSRMTLIHTDSAHFIQTIEPNLFDVAYYDPMFMPRRKSALVKKDMQIMHALLGEDPADILIEQVLSKVRCLVVKRAKADPVFHASMHHAVQTGPIRYEIYYSHSIENLDSANKSSPQ